MEKVSEAQRTGGADKGEALLAEVFRLLGNIGYRKLIEALERQTCVVYTKDEKVVDKALRKAYFSDVDELGQAYQLQSSKRRFTINRPFRSESLFNSWQSSECSSSIAVSWIGSSTAATSS